MVVLRAGRRLLRGPQVHLRLLDGRSRSARTERLLRRQRRLQVLVAVRVERLLRRRGFGTGGAPWNGRQWRLRPVRLLCANVNVKEFSTVYYTVNVKHSTAFLELTFYCAVKK